VTFNTSATGRFRGGQDQFALFPQPPQNLIERARLTRLLDDSTTTSLTVVVAPAGSGKSALLAAWIRRRNGGTVHRDLSMAERPLYWVRPEAGVAELGRALLAAAGSPAAADDDRPLSADDIVEGLGRATRVPRVTVVDDTHLLGAEGLGLLGRVLRRHPEAVRLLLATRHDLALPITELELGGRAAIVRGDQLVFTDDEAARLVTAHGVHIGRDREAIIATSRGWAAALVLGAHTVAGAADRTAARTALAGGNQPILDYLLGEVFATLPARARHVLLCTGARDEISATDAVVLSGEQDAPALLADLARSGLLVTAAEHHAEPRWTYHPLLRELLRRHVGPGGDGRPLYTAAQDRAARHFLSHGAVTEAIGHAIRAGDGAPLTDLLIEHGSTLLAAGHHTVLADALDAVPDAARRSPAALALLVALQRCSVGDIDAAVRLAPDVLAAADAIVAAEDGRAAHPPRSPAQAARQTAMITDAAILRCWLARFGWYELSSAIMAARRVIGCPAPREASGGTQDHRVHGRGPTGRRAPTLAGKAWLLSELAAAEMADGDAATAADHLAEAAATARALQHDALLARALAHQSLLAVMTGTFQTAAVLGRAALETADRAGLGDLPFTARAHIAIAWAHYYVLDFAGAAACLQRAEQSGGAAGDLMLQPLSVVLRARLLAASGNLDAGRQLLAVPQPPGPGRSYVTWLLAFARGQLALHAGDLGEATRQAEILTQHDWMGNGTLFAGWLAAERGDDSRASAIFEAILRRIDGSVSPVATAAAAVCRTRLLIRRGEMAAARRSLYDVLTMAASQRLLYPLLAGLSAGPAYLDLLREHRDGADPHPFAAEAYAAITRYARPPADAVTRHVEPPPAPVAAAPVPVPSAAGPTSALRPAGREAGGVVLTPREADVLAELALGESYVEIGRTLYVTENTVKTHVAALYRKLDSSRRSEALRRARTLGLL
jgi:LuxR family maltose regulon positive regulatory protein